MSEDERTMTIGEYCERVRRLRVALPDLESGFNDDEGLTLDASVGGERVVFIGEPAIVHRMEEVARAWLARVAETLR